MGGDSDFDQQLRVAPTFRDRDRGATRCQPPKRWSTSDKVESEYAEVAGRLSSMLLAPVATQLKIVGDGALQ